MEFLVFALSCPYSWLVCRQINGEGDFGRTGPLEGVVAIIGSEAVAEIRPGTGKAVQIEGACVDERCGLSLGL